MVKYICSGWVFNNEAADRHAAKSESITQKRQKLAFIYNHIHEVKTTATRMTANEEVLCSAELMDQIFNKLQNHTDKANVAVVCKRWAQLFLIQPDAPRLDVDYNRSLWTENHNGLATLYRGTIAVSQRCRCCETTNVYARTILHGLQSASMHRPHLQVIQTTRRECEERIFRRHPHNDYNDFGGAYAIGLMLRSRTDVIHID